MTLVATGKVYADPRGWPMTTFRTATGWICMDRVGLQTRPYPTEEEALGAAGFRHPKPGKNRLQVK
jgi:hypothetical protein